MGIWKTLRVSHIPTPPATTANYGLTKRYTNIPLGTKDRSDQVKGVITHSHFLDPLHHCHGFLLFIRFHKIRLTCSNSAANRGNSEIHSLDEPAAQRSGTRQQNVFLYHSGRQASAATPSASPGPGQGRSIAFQLRPASPDLKRPRLLAA